MQSASTDPILDIATLGALGTALAFLWRAFSIFIKSKAGKQTVRAMLDTARDTDEHNAAARSVTTDQLTDALDAMTKISGVVFALNADLRQERELSQAERKAWASQALIWQNEQDALRQRAAGLEQRIDELEQARDSLQRELDTVQSALRAAKLDYERAHADMGKAQSSANRYEMENRKLRDEKNKLAQRIEDMTTELAQVRTELEIANARLTELERGKTGELRAIDVGDEKPSDTPR
jgi:chromosome segregation ATPase